MTEPLYRLDAVSVGHGDGRPALDNISLDIHAGERVVLLGTNGSGKTTLLKVLDALRQPDAGQWQFAGSRVDRRLLTDRAWRRAFRSRVVLMFQHPEAMLFNPTVAEEIGFGLRHLPAAERERRVIAWARTMRLECHLQTPPPELSGGEKQRLCLACLLALEPQVLLLDEPTANLDPRTAGWLLDWLGGQPITTVIATHQLGLAPELGRRALILSEDHRLVYDGSVEGALADTDLLLEHGLAHVHRHHHGAMLHAHPHAHDW